MEDTDELDNLHLQHITTHPNYLHSNSTSHKWVFGAIAELIDNAVDAKATRFDMMAFPDVKDKRECDKHPPRPKYLVFQDNGTGMSFKALHKMLSLGHCSKGEKDIGKYGNGFKSGSMRVGKDAIIFTRDKDSGIMSVGLLSQTFLADIKATEVLVPMFHWTDDEKEELIVQESFKDSLKSILKYSPFPTLTDIASQFEEIPSHGTRIIVYNLRTLDDGSLELKFNKWPDIRLSEPDKDESLWDQVKPMEVSLRSYCQILYLEPKLIIYIRGVRVRPLILKYNLFMLKAAMYRPQLDKEQKKDDSISTKSTIYFGFNAEKKQNDGFFLYNRKRLIKGFMRVGMQLQGNSRGNGVVGIIDADFLEPTHNKQDFVNNSQYVKFRSNLVKKLNSYWTSCNIDKPSGPGIRKFWENVATEKEDMEVWLQCDRCLKWRRTKSKNRKSEETETWTCDKNSDPQYSTCGAPQEEPEVEYINEADVKKKSKRKQEEKDYSPPKSTNGKKTKRVSSAPLPKGKDAIGCKCEVYWMTEEKYFPGKIIDYSPENSEYRVQYEDGDVFWEADDSDLIIHPQDTAETPKTPKKAKKRKRDSDSELDTESDAVKKEKEYNMSRSSDPEGGTIDLMQDSPAIVIKEEDEDLDLGFDVFPSRPTSPVITTSSDSKYELLLQKFNKFINVLGGKEVVNIEEFDPEKEANELKKKWMDLGNSE